MTVNIHLPDFGKVIEEVTAEFKERVQIRTPVRTGRAQGGWQTSIQGESGNTSGRIFNEVPYVGYLEDGTSKMEGFHMVAVTMEEVPDMIKAALERQTQS